VSPLEAGESAGGLLGSLRALLATLIAIGHNRLALFSVEIQEEIDRAAGLLLWSLAALLMGSAALVMLSLSVLLWVDPARRAAAAALLGLAFLAAAIAAAATARSRLALKPRPFDATLTELAKDHDLLKP
jgi:uncharacterized membrane protein YqjE